MAEMKASLILELVDRLTGQAAGAKRAIEGLDGAASKYAATSAGMRATAVRSGSTTLLATRATNAQAVATDRLARSAGRYNAHVVSLHRRAEGGGPSAMALGRTYAMTRAFDHLNKKAEEYIAISRRRPLAEREAMAAAAKARGAQVSYYGLMRRDERMRGGAFNGVAGGVAAARWSRRGGAGTVATSPAEAAAVSGGLASTVAPGVGVALAGRAGMMAAGAAGATVVGGVGMMAAATPAALSLERAMSDVRRATGATNAELDEYQQRVLTIARATGRTKEEVAGLMAAGASERRRGNDLVSYASLAARASQAWGERASRTGETLSNLGNIYRANQPRLEGIADAIQTAATATRTKATDLAGFLREVGQEGQSAGLSAENMTAYGAALRAAGAEASASHKAMSSIVSTLSDASNQGGDFDKALRSMGLRTRTFSQAFRRDANGTILDFLNRLNRLAPDRRNSAISNIFGSDQAEEIKRLAEQVDRVRTLQGQLNDQSRTRGAVRREFDAFSEADFARIERAKQAIDGMTARLGRAGAMLAGSLAGGVNRFLDNIDRYEENKRRGEAALARESYDRRIDAIDEEAKRAREVYDFRRQEELNLARRRLEGLRSEARQREFEQTLAGRAGNISLPAGEAVTRSVQDANDHIRKKFFDDVLAQGGPQRPPDALRRQHDQQRRQATAAEVMAAEGRRNAPAQGTSQGPDMRDYLAGLQQSRAKVETEAAQLRAAIDSVQDAIAAQGGRATSAQSYEMRALQDALSKVNAEIDRLTAIMNTALDGAASQAYSSGVKIAAQLAAGITAGGPAVSAAMQAVAARAMRNLPASPAKEGPFRRLGHAGEQIVTQLAAGMGNGDEVSSRMRSLAADAMNHSNRGSWPMPRTEGPAGGDGAGTGSLGAGAIDRSISVHVDIGGVTIAPNGQNIDGIMREVGERVAARVRSSLHEDRA